MVTQEQIQKLNEALLQVIEDPSKYFYHLDDDDWVKIHERENPENIIYIDHWKTFIAALFESIKLKP